MAIKNIEESLKINPNDKSAMKKLKEAQDKLNKKEKASG